MVEVNRRQRDTTVRTRVRSFLDACLLLGYWWFQKFEYERHHADGSLWERFTVRRTLAGYTIPWGRHVEYYDNGTKACEGVVFGATFPRRTKLRKFKYWLPNGVSVSQHEWMRYHFGPEIDGCADSAWEK